MVLRKRVENLSFHENEALAVLAEQLETQGWSSGDSLSLKTAAMFSLESGSRGCYRAQLASRRPRPE